MNNVCLNSLVGFSSVKGHLKHYLDYWNDSIGTPKFVLDIIPKGYSLPFATFLSSCFLRNNRSALLA